MPCKTAEDEILAGAEGDSQTVIMNLDEIVKCTRLTMDILKWSTLTKANRGKVNINTEIDNSFKASLSPLKFSSQIKGNSTNNYNSLETLDESSTLGQEK